MSGRPSLNRLWHGAPATGHVFDPQCVDRLPDTARRYLAHAIAPGIRLASAVRLRMHGDIRLGRWFPFTAEQLIRPDRGLIWQATVRMHGLPVVGFDRLIDGAAQMRWRLLGLVPLMQARGPDITRSAAGRLAAETVWLPSCLCGDAVRWEDRGTAATTAQLCVAGEATAIELGIGDEGGLRSIRMQRWGNPGGGAFRSLEFGAHVEDEATFAGYTIPSRLRVGWHIRERGFASDGEFFRVTIDAAEFR